MVNPYEDTNQTTIVGGFYLSTSNLEQYVSKEFTSKKVEPLPLEVRQIADRFLKLKYIDFLNRNRDHR